MEKRINIHFRAGVGVVLYQGDNSDIFIFNRSDKPAVWQFPQGGLDLGENADTALWRELYEETAIKPEDISLVIKYPTFLSYTYPSDMLDEVRPGQVGQTHSWYFLKIKTNYVINLENSPDKEFSDYRKIGFVDFINSLDKDADFKYPVYKQLFDFFEANIKK